MGQCGRHARRQAGKEMNFGPKGGCKATQSAFRIDALAKLKYPNDWNK
jgi:hypothetical protein